MADRKMPGALLLKTSGFCDDERRLAVSIPDKLQSVGINIFCLLPLTVIACFVIFFSWFLGKRNNLIYVGSPEWNYWMKFYKPGETAANGIMVAFYFGATQTASAGWLAGLCAKTKMY
jgi:hypothetical protein